VTARQPFLSGAKAAALVILVLLMGVRPGRLAAQDSQFGIRGLGTPGKWESVRARSAGGAFAPFDPFSPMIDASLVDARRMSASITTGTSWRDVDASGNRSALRGTRFPALVLTGPVSSRIVVGGGFATYLDRTFGVIVHDTVDIRGVPQPITDQITSDGAITDLRLAVAARVNRRLALGLGIHRLTGSTRVVAMRTFADTINYRTTTARDEVAYGATGGSASVLFDMSSDLRLGGWVRTDSKLRADVGGRTAAENDLPLNYGAGVQWRAGAQATLAGMVMWRNWTTTGIPNSHDTFNWSLGLEVGRVSMPFRFGVRGGQMPFGIGQIPTEVGYSAGLGRQFSGGRGRLDIGLERLDRKGTGLTERVWTLLLGLTVRP
jgi:hypothetical protein